MNRTEGERIHCYISKVWTKFYFKKTKTNKLDYAKIMNNERIQHFSFQ